MNKKDIVTENEPNVQEILKDFGVVTEDQLQNDLTKDWDVVKCCICHRDISLLNCKWIGGDPCHINGC